MATDPSAAAFPPTRWSRILAAGGQRDLDGLARDYWRPIVAYLGARLRCPAEAAHDLAQEAFVWMLEVRLFDRADPQRGSFRGLLKTALHRFAIEHHRRATAQKRGGGVAPCDLDDAPAAALADATTPDQVLDAAWRQELLQRAVAQLERELIAAGRTQHWLVFRDWFLADDASGTELDRQTLAARHQLAVGDVANRLAHAKRRFREILRTAVADTVSDAADLAAELRWLFGTDRP